MERRRFSVKAGGVLATAGAAAVVDGPNVIAQPKFQWRMSTTWTPALDVWPGSAPQLKTGFRGKVEILQLPAPVLPALKKLAAEVVKEESEESPMASAGSSPCACTPSFRGRDSRGVSRRQPLQ
jgi:TRAP-type mannitol/chloroaromatic compound transport system substrate-binding protein